MKRAAIAYVIAYATIAHADAEQRRQAGLALYQAGKYAEAAVELEAAYAEKPSAKTGFALAQSLRLAGNCTRALVFYRAVLLQVSGEAKPRVEAGIHECESRAAEEAAARRAEADEEARRAAAAEAAQRREADRRDRERKREPTATPPAPHWSRDGLGGVLVGAGVIALGGSGYLLYRAGSHYDAAEAADRESVFARERSAGDRKRLWGTIVGATGGALVALGVVRYVVVANRSAPATVGFAVDDGAVVATLSLPWF